MLFIHKSWPLSRGYTHHLGGEYNPVLHVGSHCSRDIPNHWCHQPARLHSWRATKWVNGNTPIFDHASWQQWPSKPKLPTNDLTLEVATQKRGFSLKLHPDHPAADIFIRKPTPENHGHHHSHGRHDNSKVLFRLPKFYFDGSVRVNDIHMALAKGSHGQFIQSRRNWVQFGLNWCPCETATPQHLIKNHYFKALF